MVGYHRYHGHDLSPREREVVELMAKGQTNGEIAERLDISFATAKNHVSAIISKLGVETREEAVERWRREQRVGARFSPMMRGMAGLTPLKLAGMATAAGVLALGAVAVVGSTRSDAPAAASIADETPTPTAAWAPTPTPRPFIFDPPEPLPQEPRCAIDFDSAVILAAVDLGPESVELRGVPNSDGPGVCLQMNWTPAAPDEVYARPAITSHSEQPIRWEDAQYAGYPYLCSGGGSRRSPDVSYVVVLCALGSEVARVVFAEDGVARDLDIHRLPRSFGTTMQFVFFSHDLDVVRLMEYYDAEGELIYRPFPVPNLDDLSPGRVETPDWTEIEFTGGSTGADGTSWNDGQGVFRVSETRRVVFRIESNTESPPRIIVSCSPIGVLEAHYETGPDEHGSGTFAVDFPGPQASCRFLVPAESHGVGQYTIRPIVD